MLNGEDMRRKPFIEYKAALRKLLRQNEDIQYVAHIKGGGAKMFQAACKLGLEGLSPRNWMRRIGQVRRKPGSRSRTRRHPLRLALSMGRLAVRPRGGPKKLLSLSSHRRQAAPVPWSINWLKRRRN